MQRQRSFLTIIWHWLHWIYLDKSNRLSHLRAVLEKRIARSQFSTVKTFLKTASLKKLISLAKKRNTETLHKSNSKWLDRSWKMALTQLLLIAMFAVCSAEDPKLCKCFSFAEGLVWETREKMAGTTIKHPPMNCMHFSSWNSHGSHHPNDVQNISTRTRNISSGRELQERSCFWLHTVLSVDIRWKWHTGCNGSTFNASSLFSVVVVEENQSVLEWVVTNAGGVNNYQEVFVTVDEYGLFSAVNKGEWGLCFLERALSTSVPM